MLEIILGNPREKTIRSEKGKSLLLFPEDCVVLDIETTGLSPSWDEIIEISALRVRDGQIADTFSSLVKPENEIDEFITELTGITNEMLASAPSEADVLPLALDFIGADIIVGHNVNFDINFLYDHSLRLLKKPLTNDFVDTMRISRKVLPELEHHRLCDIAKALNVEPKGEHRALADCETTFGCLCRMKEKVEQTESVEEFLKKFSVYYNHDFTKLKPENGDFDETHPLFGMRCVFTGALERMTRTEAAQIVVNLGGFCDNGITKKTNFLILGNNDYCSTIKNGKSNKQKKAEEYKLKGMDIEIIPESVFYDMIEEN